MRCAAILRRKGLYEFSYCIYSRVSVCAISGMKGLYEQKHNICSRKRMQISKKYGAYMNGSDMEERK